MIFIEPDVDCFRLHLRDVWVPAPVLVQNLGTIAGPSASAPTSALARPVSRCNKPNGGNHNAPLSHSCLKTETTTEAARARPSSSATREHNDLYADEASSCAKITLEERADALHRALLSTLHARFPYETLDTLEYAYVLVVTHHTALSLGSQAVTEDELHCLTSLSGFLPEELRYRTFPSHLNTIIDPASVVADATTFVKPAPPATMSGVAADSATAAPAASSAARPSIRVMDDNAATSAVQEEESAAHVMTQALHSASMPPRFYDSIFLLSRALTPEQQALYYEMQLSGRCPVTCEAVHQVNATTEKANWGSGACGNTNTRMELFSVIQGNFTHYVPVDGSGGGNSAAKAARPATSCSSLRHVAGESVTYRVSSTAPSSDEPAQAASRPRSVSEARSLYFSVYRIPLSRFRPAEQQYYTSQREELRWRQRHRGRSSYHTWWRKGQSVRQATSTATPSCGSCNSSESEADGEDWEKSVGPTVKAASPLSGDNLRRNHDVASAIEKLFSSEGHSVSGAAEQAPTAEQRSAFRFFRTCHEVLTNYAIAHSPYADTGAMENEEAAVDRAPSPSPPATTPAVHSPSYQQDHPRLPWFPRRFSGVSYVGVTRLLYSLAPCNCYHLVMKDHNALYYAQSHRAPYKPQTAQLCLVSDLSPETGDAAALQRQQDDTGRGGGGVLRLAQLKSSTSPLTTTSRGVGENHTYCGTELHRAVTAASAAPPTAPASAAEVRRRRVGEQKTQAVQPRAPSQMPDVTGQVLSLGRAAPGPRADKLAVGDGAGGAAAIGRRSDLVCMSFPSRAPSPERADRASVQTWVTTAATTHGRSHPPSPATPMQPCGDLVSATDGFLCVSVSLICNSISGNPQTRLQNLTEKGVHVPSFLLPDGARTVGSPDAAPSCRSSHDVASVDGGADAAAVNLFKALSQSSFAHHKLRYGCIRSVISVAVLDSSQLMSHANPAAAAGGGTSSDEARQYGTREATQLQLSQDYSCRGLVDHTWLSIPVQRTPAEQEAIHWMPVMLGCTDCVSDVGLRTAVHLGIFPHASPPSRGAKGSLTGLSAACLPTSADQFDGVLPTRDGTLSSLRPSQRKKSTSTTAAGYAHADARPSNDKKDMSRRMPPVAPLRPYPVNCAKDGVTATTSATTASPSCAAAINVRAAPPNTQEKSESPPAGRECEREAVAAPATTISLVRSSSSSPGIRVEQAHTPVNSFATLHQQKGVPTAFNSAGGDHSHAGPHRMAGTASPPLTRPSSPSRRPDAQVSRTTTTFDRLSITVTAPNEKSQMGHKNVNVDFDEEEQVGAPIPPATATSVRLARGGIALTFDAWPAQQRKSPSSFKAGGAFKARRPRANLTPESVQGSVEFLRDCSVAVTRSRHGGDAVKSRSDNEASVETAADSFDGDDDYLERCPSPIRTRASARTPQAVGWTPPRGTNMTRVLAAAQHADNTRRGCGGAGVGDDAKFNLQSSGAFAAALPGYSAGAREAPQAATKTINWADKPFSSATATRTGTHTGGSLHFPSAFHTTVETTGMAEEQLDAEGSVPRRGVAMPTTYAAAAERHAGVLGTSGNPKSSRSSGSPQVSLWASRLNPFLAQAHKTPAANSSQPYHLDVGASSHPPPLPHCFASYTPFQRASGLPQHVQQQQQQQQQQQAPLLAAHCAGASATPTPTHRFSALFTPFGQGTELPHQTAAPTPEQQRLLHTHPQDRQPLPASRQYSTGATGFSAASAPHSRVLPSTLDLSASGVSVSSNSDSASMWLPLQQHPSASPPSQECFFDDAGALHTTCEKREDRRGTVIAANTATPTATGDGDIAPRGVQSAARPSAYFSMTWNARKTVQGASEQMAEPPQQQQRLSGGVAGHPFSSRWLSSPPRHETYEQTQEPQSHPRSSFYPPSSPLGLPSSFAAARSAPPLSVQTSNRSAHYTAPARQTIGAGYPSLLPPPLAPRRGSGGGGQTASAADARHLSRSLFIDEYDNTAATVSSVPHLHGNGQGASRVRPRGLSAMDAAWWQPVRELSSAPNLRYGAAIPAADHSRSSTSALCLPGTDQPYNLLRSTTSDPNGHRRDLYGNDGGCQNAGDATADDLAFQQRRRHSYYCCDASSLGCGAATAPLHPVRTVVPPSRLGGLKADAGFEENQGVDEVCAAELSLSPVKPRRTQMQTPFAMRRARCAAATAGHSLGPLSCRRPPLAPRSTDGDAARNTLSGGAGTHKLHKFCAGYGATMPSYSAAWRDGLSVRERVQLRRWALDKEERLHSYRTHLQENYLWGSMPKRYCFERQAGDAAADMTSASLGSGPVRESDVEGDGKQQQLATVGYAAWTPRTTAVPPVRHQTAGVLQVERDAQDFRLGGHCSAPESTTLEVRGLSVDAARVYQAEAHLRQQAKQQAYMEARQQVEELLDGAAAAGLATTGVNVSFTLRDVATVFLRLPRTSLHVPRTPGSGPPYVIGGAGLEVLDICHAVCRTEGVSCFLSRRPTQLRGGWTSYLERINLYQEPFFLRDQAFVLLLPVPHAPTLKVCVAIHNINDLLALVCQTPVARILPTTEETWMRQRQYGFEDANGDAEEPQEAEAVVEERRWLFGLFTTRRLAPAAGARAPRKAQQQLPSLEDSDVARRAECCRLRREYQMDGLCLTWRHRARLWYALLRAGLNCLELPACTSPFLIDPVACKARCALLCGRIAAYAVAHYRLETLKAIRQLYLETRAAELSKDRMLKPCDRTHHGTTRGIRLGRTRGSSSHGAASRLLCTSPTLASVSAQQERCGECFDSDGVSSTVHQGIYSEARSGARDSALKTAPYNYFSSTDEAARDPRAVRSGVAFTLDKPSITCSRQPPLAASTSASFHPGHFESARQRMGNRSDEQHQWEKTSIPPQPSAMRDASRAHPPLRRLASSSRDGWAAGPPTPRTTRSMELRLAATQRVAAGDVPAASLRHATHRSGLGEGRLTFSDCSDTFGLPSHRGFMPAPGRPSAPPPRQQQQQPLWSSDLGTCATSASPVEGLDGEIDTAWNHTRARNNAAATAHRHGGTPARPVLAAPGITSANVLYDVEADNHRYASGGACGAMHLVRSAATSLDQRSHASSASHGLFSPARSTVASYPSGTSLAPSSKVKVSAAATGDAQRIVLPSTATSTDLDPLLHVDRDGALASALARLTEDRAANIAPPLTAVLSMVPLAAQPVRGAGAGVVDAGDAPTATPANASAPLPLYAGFIPTPLEVQQHLAQPFNLSIGQVQQLVQWQWEHHQHCYTLMPMPLFIGPAAGPTEVDLSLRLWSSPQRVDSASRGGFNGQASAASPSYAVSPLARELLLHLLRWSWLLPIDHEATQCSRRRRLATTTSHGISSFVGFLILPSARHRSRWRILPLIVLLVAAAEYSAWCLRALLFFAIGYCALNCMTVGLLTPLPSHRGARSRRSCGRWLPQRWWWGMQRTGTTGGCRRGHPRSASRLARNPFPVPENNVPPIENRVSLLYSLGESTTLDMLERRRVHCAAQAVLVRVLRLQSAAASLLSRCQLFFFGYSTALSLWVVLLLVAYALLYVAYLEAGRVVQRSPAEAVFTAAVGQQRGAFWSAKCSNYESDKAPLALWQVTRGVARAIWMNTYAASVASFGLSQPAASASTGAAVPPLEPLQPTMDGDNEAAAAGVAGTVETQLFGHSAAVVTTERGGGREVAGEAHGHHTNPSYFYQNGRYYAYDAEPPAWAKSEAATAVSASPSTGAPSGVWHARPPAQPQQEQQFPSVRLVQSQSERLNRVTQSGASDGKDTSGSHRSPALDKRSADAMDSKSVPTTTSSSVPYRCPSKWTGSSAADPSVLWFLVIAYIVTVCLPWSPYRWLWWRVWSILTHDDALARRPLLTV